MLSLPHLHVVSSPNIGPKKGQTSNGNNLQFYTTNPQGDTGPLRKQTTQQACEVCSCELMFDVNVYVLSSLKRP